MVCLLVKRAGGGTPRQEQRYEQVSFWRDPAPCCLAPDCIIVRVFQQHFRSATVCHCVMPNATLYPLRRARIALPNGGTSHIPCWDSSKSSSDRGLSGAGTIHRRGQRLLSTSSRQRPLCERRACPVCPPLSLWRGRGLSHPRSGRHPGASFAGGQREGVGTHRGMILIRIEV